MTLIVFADGGIDRVSRRNPRGSTEIRLRSVVQRHHSDLPRFVVVPSDALVQWELDGTTTIRGSIGDVEFGRRSLKPWDRDRWFIDLPERLCTAAGIDTDDPVELRLLLATTELPSELRELLTENAAARDAWSRLTDSQRRSLRESLYAAKRSSTRARRARRALLGDEQDT